MKTAMKIVEHFERTLFNDARLWVHGRCSACGKRASKRVSDDNWFHIHGDYDDYVIRSAARDCGKPDRAFQSIAVYDGEAGDTWLETYDPWEQPKKKPVA